MVFIGLLLFLLLFTGTTCVLFKKDFGKCIPISFILPTLVLYFSGILFKTFTIGYILIGIYSLIFPGFIVYSLIKKKSLKELKENYFSIGLCLFLVLYVIINFINIGACFERWDEFSFWGYLVKKMLALNALFLSPFENISPMVTHPPFISLWEMLVCKLSGGYSEFSINMAIQLFQFMFFIPFTSGLKFKDNKFSYLCKSVLAVVITMLIVYTLDYGEVAKTAYVDVFTMLYFTYCFGLVIFNDNYKDKFFLFSIATAMSGFLLNKQIVLALFLVIIFYALFKYLLDNKFKIKFEKKSLYSYGKVFIFLVLIPLIVYKPGQYMY